MLAFNEVIYEVICYSCGKKLDIKRMTVDTGGGMIIDVLPCSECLGIAIDLAVAITPRRLLEEDKK